jgi:hypothetical protein
VRTLPNLKRNTKEKRQLTPKYSTQAADARASEPLAYDASPPPLRGDAQPVAHARGFAAAFALNPILALTAIVTDCMVSAIDAASIGTTAPVLWLIASAFMFTVVYMGQKKWAGDDKESAFIKALIVGFLTALPTPLPSFLTIPSGIVGMVQAMRRAS